MMRIAPCAALLLAAGCLGDLVKPPGEDGGMGGGDAMAPDAGGTVAWPGDLAIRTSLVADLNNDAYPDLVLLNDPETADDRGVLVFFDRQDGFFAAPDQFLSTAPLHPLVVVTGDFVGGAPLDLVVVASNADDDPYVVVFEGSGESSFAPKAQQGFPELELTAGTVAAPTPVFAAPVYISDTTQLGLVFGDSDLAVMISPDDWTNLTTSDDVTIDVGTSTMNAVAGAPSAQENRQDLFVVDNERGYWLQNDGSATGGFGATPTELSPWAAPNQRAFFFFDLEQDFIPDLMTLDQSVLEVGLLSWGADELSMNVYRLDPAPTLGDSYGEALFAADIDGIFGMDLLVLDDIDGDDHFGIDAARNIAVVDADTMTPDTGRVDRDATHIGDPTRLVAGDFDRDGIVEVWVFDPSLALNMCLTGEIYDVDQFRFVACE
jgi:hypothetical protein